LIISGIATNTFNLDGTPIAPNALRQKGQDLEWGIVLACHVAIPGIVSLRADSASPAQANPIG
jgi:hypothetical protein